MTTPDPDGPPSPTDRARTFTRVWAGWRSDYVASASAGAPAGEGSVFTRILRATAAGDLTDEDAYVVARGGSTFAILNAYPYGTGHLLVLPYREVGTLEELAEGEATELWATIRAASAAITAAYRPQGINVGFNIGSAAGAGIPSHLHGHVLPRWDADANFMTTVAETRVLPEDLPTTWRKLRDAWPA